MQAVNTKNQCFVVWSDEIEGRLEPYFYKPEFINFVKIFDVSKFKTKALNEISEKIASGATPKSKGLDYTSKENGIPFIRSGNINEDEKINFDETLYIKKGVHNKKLRSSQLKKGDVLIAIVGATIGQVSVYNYEREANINQAIALVRCKENINPRYIKLFLLSKFGQKQLDRIKRPVARANINLDEIGDIKILLPPLQTQNQIVEIMESAYREKAEKEAEAEKLLNSIDDYVLDELGIKMPEINDKMCFIVNSGEVINKRIDPKGYAEIPRAILKAIKKSKYQLKLLSDLIQENIAGQWGEDPQKVRDKRKFILVRVLRNTNFDNKTNLNFDEVAERLIEKNKFENIKLKNGDILVEKSGGSPIQPVGRVALIEDIENDFTFSNFLQCFRINTEKCLPEYLFAFLKALYSLNYMEYIQNQTTGIKNLIIEDYLKIPVPLPPLDIQKAIATNSENKIKQAEQLKEESKNIVENAKKEVEKIILG